MRHYLVVQVRDTIEISRNQPRSQTGHDSGRPPQSDLLADHSKTGKRRVLETEGLSAYHSKLFDDEIPVKVG